MDLPAATRRPRHWWCVVSARLMSPTHRRELRGGTVFALWLVMTAVFLVLALVGCGPAGNAPPAPTDAPPPVQAPNTPDGP